MNEQPPEWKEYTLTLRERRHEYGAVDTYVFSPQEPVPFTAGEYGHVRLFGMPPETKAVRELSFSSAPHDPDICFTVDSRSGSPYQKRLQALNMGERVGLFKIKGHMLWPPEAASVVMIAGGIGVTPFRSMLRDRREHSLPVSVALFHVSRDEFLFRDELAALADAYVPLGREELEAKLAEVVAMHPDAAFYTAGSPRFVESVRILLESHGVTRLESDTFKGLADDTLSY